ncbi:MAG: hypothetical protein EP343_24725 [Deltaproteobacteria bacterium]|nr:MAG: hypothetical protein EP343_24725 [Deltaproteobacteria bacterium]
MATEHFNPEIYRSFFGVEEEQDIQFAEEMLDAVGAIDRALVPRAGQHPYMEQIKQGAEGLSDLLGYLEEPMPGTAKGDVLDAFAYIFLNMEEVPQNALDAVRELLKDSTFGPLAARTLAIGQDQAFLTDMMQGFASDDPGEVASTAMLMGYGRFRPALPALLGLLSPMRFVESRAIIWALGELAAEEAIPHLTQCLAEGFRIDDALIALGKIGNVGTVGLLVPYIMQGETESRAMALRALSMVLENYNDSEDAMEELSEHLHEMLNHIALEDKNRTSRFYALLCLGRLGEKMDQAQIRQALDMSIADEQMSSFQRFFVKGKK